MAPPEVLRCFIALPLSEAVIAQIDATQRALKRRCPQENLRWVRPQDIHLTLFFLGDVLDERLAAIKEGLAVVARYAEAFTFEVAEIGAFPNLREPRVIWVGIREPVPALTTLHGLVNEAMVNAGFPPEARAFSPHLTLARMARRASREDAREVGNCIRQISVGALGEVDAVQLVLFRSFLKPTGAEYLPLATYALRQR